MDPVERINKLREERLAREKARILKLQELNLKKYGKEPSKIPSNNSNVVKKNVNVALKPDLKAQPAVATSDKGLPKQPRKLESITSKQEKTVGIFKPPTNSGPKSSCSIIKSANSKESSKIERPYSYAQNKHTFNYNVKPTITNTNKITKQTAPEFKKPNSSVIPKPQTNIPSKTARPISLTRQSIATQQPKPNIIHRQTIATLPKSSFTKPSTLSRQSIQLKTSEHIKANPKRESVFDRLYKPKQVAKPIVEDNVEKLKTNPDFLKKLLKQTDLLFSTKKSSAQVPKPSISRRSISAVHFKRVSKNELPKCMQKWSSVGERLDNEHLKEANEDDAIIEEKIISAVKSERKKVKFLTPMPYNLNTPRPEELQERLSSWLQKRGKSLDSYHHLQCFGIHHFTQKQAMLQEPPKFELLEDENKENIALESDSDDGSYNENMNITPAKDVGMNKWRSASFVSDSVDFNETQDSTLSEGLHHHVDEVLLGALNDLTELLREGFDWEQCARWLRAVHERFPFAPETAAYWECRAALEERRGDLPASLHCWEEAIVKGTEHSVAEGNLDALLNKFMQLKISPNSGKEKKPDPKLVNVKNVFKSTIIRFAVQQAKIRNSCTNEVQKFTVTPVRRSNRLSTKRTPLKVCSSVKQATSLPHTTFNNNPHLVFTP